MGPIISSFQPIHESYSLNIGQMLKEFSQQETISTISVLEELTSHLADELPSDQNQRTYISNSEQTHLINIMLEPPIKVFRAQFSSSISSSDYDESDLSPINVIPLQSIPLETTPNVEPIQPNLVQTEYPVQSETGQEIQDQPIPEPQNLPQPEQEIPTQTIPET